MATRVLVVDDSSIFRRVVTDALARMSGIELVGTASNGNAALNQIRELKPDIVTLDVDMPVMDGIQVLEALRAENIPLPGVIMLSAVTVQGSRQALRALELGAFDFITKPAGEDISANREQVYVELAPRIQALARRMEIRSLLRGGGGGSAPTPNAPIPTQPRPQPPAPVSRPAIHIAHPELVLIGVSTGGPAALTRLLPALPADLPVPVLIVQHMPPLFTATLVEQIAKRCAITFVEGTEGTVPKAGTVYLAPGGRHMKVARKGDGLVLQITDEPPENHCRPAVDVLFRSVSMHAPGKAMAVILTGMGSDGTIGLRLLKRHGCYTIGQDEATCVVYGMPRAAAEAGVIDNVLPLDQIAPAIVSAVRRATRG